VEGEQSMQTWRMIRAVSVSTLIVVCLACTTTSEPRLVGTYRADGQCVAITLVLNPDHSFVQTAQTQTGKANRLTGKWRVDKKGNTIDFQPFLDFLNNMQGRQVGGATFPAETMGLFVRIGPVIVRCPDSDHQIDYVK